jgi:hypothetical protein
MALKKNIIIVLLVIATLFSSVFASPIEVDNVNIQDDNGDYIVLVTLDDLNVTTGNCEELVFTIEELSTSKSFGLCDVDMSGIHTYNLRDLTDSYDLLQKGNSYRLTVSTDENSITTPFLFGKKQETDGLGIIIDDVRANSIELFNNDVLQVMNGETLTIELRFTALENFDDARLKAEIDGYEHSTILDTTEIFSVIEGKTYVKTIQINLPDDMRSEKDYKLRIYGGNDLSGFTYKDYTVYVDTQRHRVDVIDMVMTPSSGVEPGQNIIANARIQNRGQKSQDSVKVDLTIPELNIVESSYVSNLNSQSVVTSEDMLLFVPESAQAGQYEAFVVLTYDNGYTQSQEEFTLNVLSPRTVEDKNLLVSYKENIELTADKESTFQIVVANPNDESKPISLVAVEDTWADVEITPSLSMIQSGDSKEFTVKITPKSAIEGEKSLGIVVKEGSKTITELTVDTYVEGSQDQKIDWVNIALAVLLVIAIIILLSLVISIAKRKGEKSTEDDYSSTEEYY